MTEVWKKAVYSRFPNLVIDLEVSSVGNVRKLLYNKVLKPQKHNGYYCIVRCKKRIKIHTLVAETFIDPRPEKMDVIHIDGNKENNNYENLKFVMRNNCKYYL